ncbi:MAG: hypothetical protein FJ405_11670 [Verrucomicrobia bacterium]|nr:hypothetical protein [Verrucomicrobiota bacterium]
MIHHKQPPQNVSFSLALLAALSLSAVGAEVGTFTGADEGEGLDLQGNFLYAVNVGTSGGAGRAGDAVFTADNVTGVTVVAGNNIPGWHSAAYGDTASDDTLETVMRSIRWSNAAEPANPVVRVQLSNLEVGVEYKLQLLFA